MHQASLYHAYMLNDTHAWCMMHHAYIHAVRKMQRGKMRRREDAMHRSATHTLGILGKERSAKTKEWKCSENSYVLALIAYICRTRFFSPQVHTLVAHIGVRPIGFSRHDLNRSLLLVNPSTNLTPTPYPISLQPDHFTIQHWFSFFKNIQILAPKYTEAKEHLKTSPKLFLIKSSVGFPKERCQNWRLIFSQLDRIGEPPPPCQWSVSDLFLRLLYLGYFIIL